MAYLHWTDHQILTLFDIAVAPGHPELAAFLGGDIDSLFETDWLDVLMGVIEIGVAYLIGMFMLRRLATIAARA